MDFLEELPDLDNTGSLLLPTVISGNSEKDCDLFLADEIKV